MTAASKPALGECVMTASHTRRACDNGGACWCQENPEEVARINAPVATSTPPREGMVRTEHGWAMPCAACDSTDFGKPCPKSLDGWHRVGVTSTKAQP